MALARAEGLTFTYPGAGQPALDGVDLELEAGEVVLLLGRSGAGKSTLVRAFAGLVPHFHGGRFAGSVVVSGFDTRRTHPAELAGTVASVFQDPEDQVVMTRVAAEVAFGLENLGTPLERILPRAHAALAAVGAAHLVDRQVAELSGGELQRICLASALALEPELLLLDEPTSQLDPDGAEAFLDLVTRLARERSTAVLVSEQRPAAALERCDRVVTLGAFDPDGPPAVTEPRAGGELVCAVQEASFAYGDRAALAGASLELRRGEVVALTGPNGSGKTTLAKLAAGLLEPASGRVKREGRAAFLVQDPGRYLVRERADEEVALGADPERARAALAEVGLAGFEARHPRDLSSGERERLALATVLVTDPDLLVLDEPTRGIDPERKGELAALLRARASGRATLVVTHDRSFAAAVADREVSLGAAPQREAVLA
jgi:energy-coupling factor transport system ATP-binding protein